MVSCLFKLVRWAFLVPFAASVALGGWLTLRAQPTELPYWQQRMVDRAVRQVQEEFPRLKGGGRLVVLPLRGDRDGRVQQALFHAIERSGRFQTSVWKTRNTVVTGQNQQHPATDLAGVLPIGRRLNTQYALFGDLARSDPKNGSETDLRMVLHLADVSAEQSVWTGEFDQQLETNWGSLTYIQMRLGSLHWMLRIGLWLVFVGLLPIVLLPPLCGVIQRESHAASLAAWLLLTASGVGAALLLAGPGTWGLAVGGLLCLGGLTALGYNLIVLGEVARIVR